MPPKRGSTRRPASVTLSSARQPASAESTPSPSSPEVFNPGLPPVRVKQSFAYGSSKTPTLPRQMHVEPTLDLAEIVETIEGGLRQAHERDFATIEEEARLSNRRVTRSQLRSSISNSPVHRQQNSPVRRQRRRVETPREAAESPGESSAQPELGHSTATPSPPVQRRLSAASIPATIQPHLTTDDVHVQQSAGLDAPVLPPHLPDIDPQVRLSGSPGRINTPADGDSTISWNVERTLHTREFQLSLEESPGGTINAPPRRFNVTHDTIQEEPEPPTPPRDSTAPDPTPSQQGVVSEPPTDAARTSVIDQPIDLPTISEEVPPASKVPRRAKLIWSVVVVIFVALGTYLFSDQIAEGAHTISTSFRFGTRIPYPALNITEVEIIERLTGEVQRLSHRITSMSKEVKSIKSEWSKVAVQATASPPVVKPQVIHKANFLSLGTRLAIDPFNTSPSLGQRPSLFQHIRSSLTGRPFHGIMPPETAFTPWDGEGDCWCHATRDKMSQIAVSLGQPMVPEEVVVEHIPKGASLNPGVAPREMEFWAQFKSSRDPAAGPDQHSASKIPTPLVARFFAEPKTTTSSLPSPTSPVAPSSLSALSLTLQTAILDALRLAYPNEPATAYSGDALLGPTFFRIGKWQYDIDGENHIQNFDLDVVLDIPNLLVDKVVIRVKSNWGSPHTCLYRLKLHGHI